MSMMNSFHEDSLISAFHNNVFSGQAVLSDVLLALNLIV